MWGLAVVSVFSLIRKMPITHLTPFRLKNYALKVGYNDKGKLYSYFSNFWKNKAFVALMIPFLLVLVSGLWSENGHYWLERLRIKLPFLILPLAFANLPPLSKKQFWGVFYVFLIAFSVLCVKHLIFYATHFQISNIGLGQGIPIPTNWNHISFSIMAVFAIFSGWELWQQKFYWKKPFERYFILSLTVFLFIAIHILSVRSAILTLYIALFFKLMELIFRQKRWKIGLLSVVLWAIMPVLAYKTIPSFKQRIDYAVWDFNSYKQGNLAQKSDSERILSLKMGVEAFKKSPIIGVGYGDIMDEVRRSYTTYFPTFDVREPHSFWLFTAIGTGIVGVFTFIMAFFTHWWLEKRYLISLFTLLHIIILMINSVDFVIEGTYGATFYAFFVGFFIAHSKSAAN